jgi:hypothetical protein
VLELTFEYRILALFLTSFLVTSQDNRLGNCRDTPARNMQHYSHVQGKSPPPHPMPMQCLFPPCMLTSESSVLEFQSRVTAETVRTQLDVPRLPQTDNWSDVRHYHVQPDDQLDEVGGRSPPIHSLRTSALPPMINLRAAESLYCASRPLCRVF